VAWNGTSRPRRPARRAVARRLGAGGGPRRALRPRPGPRAHRRRASFRCSPPSTAGGRTPPGSPGRSRAGPGGGRPGDGSRSRPAADGAGERRPRPAWRLTWNTPTATARSGIGRPRRTSRLSADLKFGTISPRTVAAGRRAGPGREAFVRQLACGSSTLTCWPPSPKPGAGPCGASTTEWPGTTIRRAWPPGKGAHRLPFVDAAMRQLRAEGWIHNRARMVAASFLVKDLLIDWRQGEQHFLRWLVDGTSPERGELAVGAGPGPTPPPTSGVQPGDPGLPLRPRGDYVRRWVPELARLPRRPSMPPGRRPGGAGRRRVVLGETYPAPIVAMPRRALRRSPPTTPPGGLRTRPASRGDPPIVGPDFRQTGGGP